MPSLDLPISGYCATPRIGARSSLPAPPLQPTPVRPGAEAYAGGDGEVGVLLCHGFTGSPASMRPWAQHLERAGMRVSVPRLPGHGTSWRELNLTRWPDWYAAVDRALGELAAGTRIQFVCGLSMGGALALRLAEEHGDRIAGLCLVNPALTSLDPRRPLLPVLRRLTDSAAGISGDIAKPGMDEIAYDRTPLHASASVLQLWLTTLDDLAAVRQPIMLFRSENDHVVEPASAELLRTLAVNSSITERQLSKSFHVATLDYDAELIFAESARFISAIADRS
jgi:carboxylesterase